MNRPVSSPKCGRSQEPTNSARRPTTRLGFLALWPVCGSPILKSKDPKNPDVWARERILPLRAPFATTVWDYINRGMPLNREGTLTPDEVYSLTAFLLFINDVIPEDQALDQQSLPKVKMPIGDNYAPLPDWKPRTKRLQGYPF